MTSATNAAAEAVETTTALQARQRAIGSLQQALEHSPRDWSLSVALGEEWLEGSPVAHGLRGSPRSAAERFQVAIAHLNAELRQREAVGECVVEGGREESAAGLFVRQWVAEMYASERKGGKWGSRAVQQTVERLHGTAPSLAPLVKEHGLEELTKEEVRALLPIFVKAELRDYDFVRPCEVDTISYKPWDSVKAKELQNRFRLFSGNIRGNNAGALNAVYDAIDRLSEKDKSKPSAEAASYLRALNEAPTSADTLEHVASRLGTPSLKGSLTRDSKFYSVLEQIDKTYNSIPSGSIGTTDYLQRQKQMARDLLMQQKDRAELGYAVALGQQGRNDEALKILTSILERDEFLSMHKVFRARATVLEALGDIERADRDFRELFRLHEVPVDIPTIDENRLRKAF